MVEQATSGEWDATMQLISELWPAFGDYTPEQAVEWQARLRSRNQLLVRAAARNVYAEKASQQPKLPWILTELRSLESHHSESAASERASEKQTQDEEWQEIRAEADLLRPILCSLPKTELAKYKLEALKCLAFMRGFTTPPNDRHSKAHHESFVSDADRDLHDDPDRWNPVMVGLVNACMERACGRSIS